METEFTPVSSLAGGMLIGLAAVMLMTANGRIAGISGFVARVLPPYEEDELAPRIAFVAGMVAAPLAYLAVSGSSVAQTVSGDLPVMAVSGFLVGFGSVLGGGCTSGHGVCGLARMSRRSFVAIGIVMAAAAGTVFLTRHIAGV